MNPSVFFQLEFWLLVLLSIVVPTGIYWGLLVARAVSRWTVLLLGLALVLVAAVDLYLLQHLAAMAKASPSLADDAVFASEITIGLYVLPALFAGVGVNVISHVLLRHVTEAENRFDLDHRVN